MTRPPPGGASEWAELPAGRLVFAPDDVGLVPVGATEQHGPHLPTGTDTMIASGICARAAARCGAVVLPAIPIGCSYGHGHSRGTLSLAPEQLAGLIRQYAEWAAWSGLRRLLFLNAHLGNSAAIGTGTDHLRLHRPDLRVGAREWWGLSPDLRAAMFAEGPDVHGNRAETAIMLHLAPGLVDLARAPAADDEDRTAGLVFRYTTAQLSRTGATGRPSEATVELGERLVTGAAAALAELVERGRTERAPIEPPPDPSPSSWRAHE
ncbi:MAG TPA: creatininase family protein [Mycobacteriales bacterium]|nr:creatininase family protein [Mycobacteriales bacterium]